VLPHVHHPGLPAVLVPDLHTLEEPGRPHELGEGALKGELGARLPIDPAGVQRVPVLDAEALELEQGGSEEEGGMGKG
jgi:hypothetical protein